MDSRNQLGTSSTPIGDGQTAQDVHDRLRNMILAGALDETKSFSQVALARTLGVSRTPLRESLRMLEREGLVLSEPNRKARIAPTSAADLDELYGLRIMLEGLAVYVTATMATPHDILELHRLMAEMDVHAAAEDREAWEIPHGQFHRQLAVHAGGRLSALTADLRDHSKRYIRRHIEEPLAWAAGRREHAEIVEAVEAGEPELAAERTGLHLARTALTLLARMAPSYNAIATRSALHFVEQVRVG